MNQKKPEPIDPALIDTEEIDVDIYDDDPEPDVPRATEAGDQDDPYDPELDFDGGGPLGGNALQDSIQDTI